MAWYDKITTSLYGRRLGLQRLSSAQDARKNEVLVGAEAFRSYATTGDSTGTNLAPYGVSLLTTVSSSCVFVLDPPLPGVHKTLVFGSTGGGAMYVKTANSETIVSTLGSSFTTLKSTAGNGGTVSLMGITTAIWAWTGAASSIIAAATTST
jgi:hypothetical protein